MSNFINPLTHNNLESPLKIKIPRKISAGSVALRDLIMALKG
jgi:hypothetical protein